MMNRRDILKIVPLAGAGIMSLPELVLSREKSSAPLCLEYLQRVVALFEKIRDYEMDNLLIASNAIARTYKKGRTCFCQWETGHSFDGDMFPHRHGDTDIFTMGYTMGSPGVTPREGDLLLVNVLRQPLDDPHKKGMFVIGASVPWCADTDQPELLTPANQKLRIKMYSDVWIEMYESTYGALLWLSGETAPIGPASGALGMITYWAMVADAVRLLASDGIAVKVKGDEPPLGGDAPFVNLSDQLGRRYFEESLLQIGQIEAELGTVRRIAKEAVDCILSGGKLYVYSRYREALSSEANAKRGGLALLNTTFADDKEFKGTNKDYMIMGIYQPDDEVDLEMLRKFRSAGMKIASIGPVTRNGIIPECTTVPGEADIHLGLMCDTYGLFAIGRNCRKVCPTSGLLVNLLFWTTAVQIADEIMERTGNTPSVLSTGALKGGAEQRKRKAEIIRLRGY
jgi:hypothetical protein